MKARMNIKMWCELEQKLVQLGAGYKVDVDNHLGIPEMVIHIDTIGVMLPELKEEE
jgi:hypothetical protein